jgi:hypothetical protein
MAALHNPRHETFAQLVAGGASFTAAYVSAGFSKVNAVSSASRLAKREDVKHRIEELQTAFARSAVNRARVTRGAVLQKLWDIAQDQNEPASSRVRALELCGKECGMFGGQQMVWDGNPESLTDLQLDHLTLHYERRVYGDDHAALLEAKRQFLIENGDSMSEFAKQRFLLGPGASTTDSESEREKDGIDADSECTKADSDGW